jgi:hypothetical protein
VSPYGYEHSDAFDLLPPTLSLGTRRTLGRQTDLVFAASDSDHRSFFDELETEFVGPISLRRLLDDRDFLRGEAVEVIHQPVNRRVGGVNLTLDNGPLRFRLRGGTLPA